MGPDIGADGEIWLGELTLPLGKLGESAYQKGRADEKAKACAAIAGAKKLLLSFDSDIWKGALNALENYEKSEE